MANTYQDERSTVFCGRMETGCPLKLPRWPRQEGGVDYQPAKAYTGEQQIAFVPSYTGVRPFAQGQPYTEEYGDDDAATWCPRTLPRPGARTANSLIVCGEKALCHRP